MKCMFFVFLVGCATQEPPQSDSARLLNEFKRAGEKVGDGIKTGVDNVRDSTCEMFNGKLECTAKKIKRDLIDD